MPSLEPSASGTEQPAKSRAELVHTGTFIRFHVGYASMRADFSPYGRTGGSNFGFAIGGTLTQGLALAGLLDFMGDGSDEGIFVGQFGIALSYYFLPLNLFAGGSIGRASGSYQDLTTDDVDEREVETEFAFAYGLHFGYEYLFENSAWGLGPSLRSWYVDFDGGSFVATGLVLSATHH